MNFQVLLNRQSFRILICMWDVDICNTLQHSTTHCNTLGGANRFGVGVEIPHLTFSYSNIATWMCATHCNTTHCNTTHCNTTCGTWIFLSPCQSTHRCFFWFVDYTLFFNTCVCNTLQEAPTDLEAVSKRPSLRFPRPQFCEEDMIELKVCVCVGVATHTLYVCVCVCAMISICV